MLKPQAQVNPNRPKHKGHLKPQRLLKPLNTKNPKLAEPLSLPLRSIGDGWLSKPEVEQMLKDALADSNGEARFLLLPS